MKRTSHGMVKRSTDLASESIRVVLCARRGNGGLLRMVEPTGSGHGIELTGSDV